MDTADGEQLPNGESFTGNEAAMPTNEDDLLKELESLDEATKIDLEGLSNTAEGEMVVVDIDDLGRSTEMTPSELVEGVGGFEGDQLSQELDEDDFGAFEDAQDNTFAFEDARDTALKGSDVEKRLEMDDQDNFGILGADEEMQQQNEGFSTFKTPTDVVTQLTEPHEQDDFGNLGANETQRQEDEQDDFGAFEGEQMHQQEQELGPFEEAQREEFDETQQQQQDDNDIALFEGKRTQQQEEKLGASEGTKHDEFGAFETGETQEEEGAFGESQHEDFGTFEGESEQQNNPNLLEMTQTQEGQDETDMLEETQPEEQDDFGTFESIQENPSTGAVNTLEEEELGQSDFPGVDDKGLETEVFADALEHQDDTELLVSTRQDDDFGAFDVENEDIVDATEEKQIAEPVDKDIGTFEVGTGDVLDAAAQEETEDVLKQHGDQSDDDFGAFEGQIEEDVDVEETEKVVDDISSENFEGETEQVVDTEETEDVADNKSDDDFGAFEGETEEHVDAEETEDVADGKPDNDFMAFEGETEKVVDAEETEKIVDKNSDDDFGTFEGETEQDVDAEETEKIVDDKSDDGFDSFEVETEKVVDTEETEKIVDNNSDDGFGSFEGETEEHVAGEETDVAVDNKSDDDFGTFEGETEEHVDAEETEKIVDNNSDDGFGSFEGETEEHVAGEETDVAADNKSDDDFGTFEGEIREVSEAQEEKSDEFGGFEGESEEMETLEKDLAKSDDFGAFETSPEQEDFGTFEVGEESLNDRGKEQEGQNEEEDDDLSFGNFEEASFGEFDETPAADASPEAKQAQEEEGNGGDDDFGDFEEGGFSATFDDEEDFGSFETNTAQVVEQEQDRVLGFLSMPTEQLMETSKKFFAQIDTPEETMDEQPEGDPTAVNYLRDTLFVNPKPSQYFGPSKCRKCKGLIRFMSTSCLLCGEPVWAAGVARNLEDDHGVMLIKSYVKMDKLQKDRNALELQLQKGDPNSSSLLLGKTVFLEEETVAPTEENVNGVSRTLKPTMSTDSTSSVPTFERDDGLDFSNSDRNLSPLPEMKVQDMKNDNEDFEDNTMEEEPPQVSEINNAGDNVVVEEDEDDDFGDFTSSTKPPLEPVLPGGTNTILHPEPFEASAFTATPAFESSADATATSDDLLSMTLMGIGIDDPPTPPPVAMEESINSSDKPVMNDFSINILQATLKGRGELSEGGRKLIESIWGEISPDEPLPDGQVLPDLSYMRETMSSIPIGRGPSEAPTSAGEHDHDDPFLNILG